MTEEEIFDFETVDLCELTREQRAAYVTFAAEQVIEMYREMLAELHAERRKRLH